MKPEGLADRRTTPGKSASFSRCEMTLSNSSMTSLDSVLLLLSALSKVTQQWPDEPNEIFQCARTGAEIADVVSGCCNGAPIDGKIADEREMI